MAEKGRFTLRPFSRPARTDFKDAFRLSFAPSALVLLKLKAGDLCQIESDGGEKRYTAIVWTAAEKIQETVVQTSKTLQEVYGLKLGDKIDIVPYDGPTAEAAKILVQAVTNEMTPVLEPGDKVHWEWFLDMPFRNAEWLTAGMIFPTDLKGQKRWFKIARIEGHAAGQSSIFKYCEDTSVSIVAPDELEDQQETSNEVSFILDRTNIGGLEQPIKQIQRVTRRFESQSSVVQLPSFYKPTQGLLLYGPKGTGKSLLVEAITNLSWRKVCFVDRTGGRETVATNLQKTFTDAISRQPSLIILDQLDSLAPKRSAYDYNASSSTATSLRQGFARLRGHNVLVVAETRHPNEIDETLRAQSRFGAEVELTVPSSDDRFQILRVIRGGSIEPTDDLLRTLSERTYGYTGADLVSLMNTAVELAEDRMVSHLKPANAQPITNDAVQMNGEEQPTDNDNETDTDAIPLQISEEDISQALTSIRPTALQEIFLTTPHTPWSSIGGYDDVKQHLRNTVSRPLRYPEQMSRFNLRPRKGLLLYGPPGCSKTLLVKALATESGLNFLAVKGAEILSMYVGESERTVREIFRKARAASPSIIFFDEIDAIASSRDSSGGGGNTGVNVLTTLLNEVDGIEELKNVLVVAATNAPQSIDSALLRPGRFDHLLYVGPPDLNARREILTNWFSKSRVSPDLTSPAGVEEVAELLDGYSGAEVIGICETAGSYAMDRFEAHRDAVEGDQVEVTKSEGEDVPDIHIERRDIDKALEKIRKGISTETIRFFEEWAKGKGS